MIRQHTTTIRHTLTRWTTSTRTATASATSLLPPSSSSSITFSPPSLLSASHLASPTTSSLYHLPRRHFAIKVSAAEKKKQAAGGDKNSEKKKKPKKKDAGKETQGGVKQSMDLSLLEKMLEQQLTAPEPVDPRSPAELALDNEYAKEYSRRCQKEHQQQLIAQVQFLRTRWAAVNALPSPLRTAALEEDMTPWPKGFQPIPWTPREYVKRFGPKAQLTQTTAAATPAKK